MSAVNWGWSYPPGCSGPPEDPPESPAREEVWEVLEKYNYSCNLIETVDRLIAEEDQDRKEKGE